MSSILVSSPLTISYVAQGPGAPKKSPYLHCVLGTWGPLWNVPSLLGISSGTWGLAGHIQNVPNRFWDLLAISKTSPTYFGTSRQSLETFQVDFRDVRDRFWRCFRHASSVWQWTLMIPQYDHLSHPYFLYYFESKSEPIQVATQNMGGVWWILICVSGDLTIVFLDIITSNKASMSTN